ncbi:hydroxymethylglutaryl-CoA reductase, degradative (plasmid) [Lichenicola cladoniae]|uniref:3-hydroxy-3-methylglutaryl coenzyme A reductase n=1 Tax=Lichenicola cladoniae TaxID=1484109 RepID=A0A6M8HZT2_9PROT|nr:hydroxymethylglutaryl-CoA reductase, degradative [Lichenicola cladoniae]NPD69863.1 hydroxymethylglutaryl-CoA reductase, degradative [Acetobacteraceae bacterium]QKE93838.1 hydroxymethylglutaryl-CoA reductase, degradative [Lichenicola cladoniae]
MAQDASSRISGFHKMSPDERRDTVQRVAGLDAAAVGQLGKPGNLEGHVADHMIENMVATFAIPVGIATNMRVDGRDVLVPMATEESSVVAAVCNSARQCYEAGGFTTSVSGGEMIAQVQLVDVSDPQAARIRILERKAEVAALCDACDPMLVRLGGGFRDLEVRIVAAESGAMVVTHLIVDTRDAMGANTVNTMAERLAPFIEEWGGGKVSLRILSNLADRRLARARATWPLAAIGGAGVRDSMIAAYRFAAADPYRAATHNKGVMNGVSAVVLATGNDTRAVEAGAHAYAARDGRYTSLTTWEAAADGSLVGAIELPMAVGLVGGATKIHPTAQACLAILGVDTAAGLARVIAAVGLAQNFGAMKALVTVGIQQGHMGLHANNVAIAVGAVGDEVGALAAILVERRQVRQDVAAAELDRLRTRG